MAAKQKLKAAKIAPSPPDDSEEMISPKQKGKKDIQGKGDKNTLKKAARLNNGKKRFLQKLNSGAKGKTVQFVNSKKLNLQHDQKSIKTIKEKGSILKEEPNPDEKTYPPKKGKKRMREDSVTEKSSRDNEYEEPPVKMFRGNDNSPKQQDAHNSKSSDKEALSTECIKSHEAISQ